MIHRRATASRARNQFAALALLPALAWATDVRAQEAAGAAHPGAFMVAAAHPLAVEAGAEILREGGDAIDAAIAVQMVLNLVEPQSSGIGGGAFLLYYDAERGVTEVYDGRETAPADVTVDLFLDAAGDPMGFREAVLGGRSVGVPGVLRLLEAAHADHGRLPWARLFAPAIDLAEQGFPVPPRLAMLLAGPQGEALLDFSATAAYFFPNGEPLQVGETLANPAFAQTLRIIADQGAEAFYTGAIADDVVAAVQTAGNAGLLSLEDLADYRVARREPVCFTYRHHEVCGMGPPSSGALTVGQILGILEHFDMASLGPGSADAWHLFAEASKLAYADRALYIADADFVAVPTAGLLDPNYLTVRAQAIAPDSVQSTPVRAGNPPHRQPVRLAPGSAVDSPGTSHVSIIDADGNAVSMTTSIESAFGSHLMVRGFLLNNQLTDFSFVPEVDSRLVANRVEPGKRPRSSMAPTMVFDPEGRLSLVVGSPGGSRIIAYVAKTLVGVIDWGLDVQTAIALPNVANRNGDTDVEAGIAAETTAEALVAGGHEVNLRQLTSGVHGVQVTSDGLIGGADPRRDGVVVGGSLPPAAQ